MKYKNYYKILELNSHATDEEIKIAYRKLAKKYHPDINPGNNVASEKFKSINEAYQILSNEVTKKKFDRIHSIYKVKDTFNDTKEKINSNGFADMFEIVFGKKEDDSSKEKKFSVSGEDSEIQISLSLEEAFFGTQKKIAFKSADGHTKKITLNIPKGIKKGGKIRIDDLGKPGINGGKPGNLYIRVDLKENDIFNIIGDDLFMNLDLTPWEAALGTEIRVKGIDSSINVKVPKGVSSGETIKIEGKGFWKDADKRGDLLLNVRIMIPKELSESETLLFKRFEEISQFNPRIK